MERHAIGPYLSKQAQDLEAPVVDLQGRRAREAIEAIAERVDQVEEYLRHGDGRLSGYLGDAR
jgi:hypothetical protein